jgi:hypothetical protein
MSNPSQSNNPWNRRYGLTRFLVPDESSAWFIRTIALSVVGIGIVLGLISWSHHRELLDTMVANGFVQQPEILAQYTRISMINAGLVIVAGSVFVTVMACFLLHRIAGPIYRIRLNMLNVIHDQAVQEVRLRDGDRLRDVADTYNQLLYKLDLIDPKPESDGKG